MRFRAIQSCFIGHHLLKPGQEIELADDYPETPGVIESVNRMPPPEAEKPKWDGTLKLKVPEPPKGGDEPNGEGEGDEDESHTEGGESASDPADPPKVLTRAEKAAATRAANKTKANQTE